MAGFTDKEVRALMTKARQAEKKMAQTDGTIPGLTLVAMPSGIGSWKLRYYAGAKQKEITIGQYPAWKLSEARAKARELRRAIDHGVDVAAEKQVKKKQAQIDARAEALDNAMRLQIMDWLSTWWGAASDGDRAELFQHWHRSAASLPGASKWPG